MDNITVSPDNLAAALEGILEEHRAEIVAGIRRETKKTMRQMVKRSKADAPKRALGKRAAGTYAKHITSKVLDQSSTGYAELWYVKPPEHALTHLLNNGHALHQGGRWEGTRFLTDITREEKTNYERSIRQVIADASR